MSFSFSEKIPSLRTFYQKLSLKDYKLENVGDAEDYRVLLANFTHVLNVYHSLTANQQEIIADITKRMGEGMAEFMLRHSSTMTQSKDSNLSHESFSSSQMQSTVDSIADYDLYCHYVAGLVGEGLSNLFVSSNLECKEVSECKQLSNSMGLLLQKTNIIRDYYDDMDGGRTWWPREIWGRFSAKLTDFHVVPSSELSLNCLNCMINDALRHLSDVLTYLGMLRNRKVFEFCAIPQVMAIATLAVCYNNPTVFVQNVKIRKGLTCWLMLNSPDLISVKRHFRRFALEIRAKIPNQENQINATTRKLVGQILRLTDDVKPNRIQIMLTSAFNFMSMFLLVSATLHWSCSMFSIQSPLSHIFTSMRSTFEYSFPTVQWHERLISSVKRGISIGNNQSIVAVGWVLILFYFASTMKSKFV